MLCGNGMWMLFKKKEIFTDFFPTTFLSKILVRLGKVQQLKMWKNAATMLRSYYRVVATTMPMFCYSGVTTQPTQPPTMAEKLRTHLRIQQQKDQETDQKVLPMVQQFVEAEVKRIVLHMEDAFIPEYEYGEEYCWSEIETLRGTFPRHSYTEKQIMQLIKNRLQENGFKVKLYYDARSPTYATRAYLRVTV